MLLLIACGNPLRQDDGAGLQLARRLASAWRQAGVPVRFRPVHQLTPELALEVSRPDVGGVIFVDTRVAAAAGDDTIRVTPLTAADLGLRGGHQMDAAAVLLYARELFAYRPPAGQPDAWLVTIPGHAFGHGEGLSSTCAAALANWDAAPAMRAWMKAQAPSYSGISSRP